MKRPKTKQRRLSELMRRIQRASQVEDWGTKNRLLLVALRQFPRLLQVEIDPDHRQQLLIHGPSGTPGQPIGAHVPADVAKRWGMLELIEAETASQLRRNVGEP